MYKLVDTCGAEFPALTPYLYSTYEAEDEARARRTGRKVMILGGGPNRIGQGIEFDYCCVHARLALKEDGFETIMVNCNPETVSTDYDTSDRLYFEPLTLEDVLAIVEREKPDGRDRAVRRPDAAEARGAARARPACRSSAPRPTRSIAPRIASASTQLVDKLGLRQPRRRARARPRRGGRRRQRIGYPVLVRPSYVLGGRAMEVIADEGEPAPLHRAGAATPPSAHRC